MKKVDYKAMSNEELTSNYIMLKRDLFNLKLQHSVGQLTNPHAISLAKKNIARILTEMTVRNIDYSKINMPVEKKKVKKQAKTTKVEKASKEPAKTEVKAEPKKAAAKQTVKAEPKAEAKSTATKTTATKKTTTKKESV